jgi:hypothetical protein
MIEVAGFSTRQEQVARQRLEDAGVEQFAIFTPNSMFIMPGGNPASIVVNIRDAIIVKSVMTDILVGGSEIEMVEDDYFDWHAEESDDASGNLEEALLAYITHNISDLKTKSRSAMMRRLNAKLKKLPGVVEDGWGREFCYPDDFGDENYFMLYLTHENASAECMVFLDAGSIHTQVNDANGNCDALAKWLLASIPAPTLMAEAA